MKKGIIFLGTGGEIETAIRLMYPHGLVLGCGCHNNSSEGFKEIEKFCLDNDLRVIESLEEAIQLAPQFIFMISYPPLIKQDQLKRCKFVNMHGALVPRFRGIHGGTWAIINGETKQGYTIHLVDEGIDSGPIYHQGIIEVSADEDVNMIRKRILDKFSEDIERVLLGIFNEEITPIEQNEEEAIYVCKRRPEDGQINWSQKSSEIHNLIRALSPPYTKGAFTYYKGEKLYVWNSKLLDRPEYIGINGQVVAKYPDKGVLFKTGDSVILVKTISYQEEEMDAFDFFKTVGARCGK